MSTCFCGSGTSQHFAGCAALHIAQPKAHERPISPAPGGVHNHGTESWVGPGVDCVEYRIGRCRLTPTATTADVLRDLLWAVNQLPTVPGDYTEVVGPSGRGPFVSLPAIREAINSRLAAQPEPSAPDLDVARVKQAVHNVAKRHGVVPNPPMTPEQYAVIRIFGYSAAPAELDGEIAAEYDRLTREDTR